MEWRSRKLLQPYQALTVPVSVASPSPCPTQYILIGYTTGIARCSLSHLRTLTRFASIFLTPLARFLRSSRRLSPASSPRQYPWEAIAEGNKDPTCAEAAKTNTPCAHVLGEVWSGQLSKIQKYIKKDGVVTDLGKLVS